MELWQQLLAAGAGLLLLFFIAPAIKPALEKSRNAEEKHWGTLLLLASVLIGFIILLMVSVQ